VSAPPDRAAAVTTSILLTVTTGMRRWLDGEPVPRAAIRTEIENTLRDEFADVARQVRGERDPPTD
jgi:hypothetical protein